MYRLGSLAEGILVDSPEHVLYLMPYYGAKKNTWVALSDMLREKGCLGKRILISFKVDDGVDDGLQTPLPDVSLCEVCG